jgi:hypothetical protein
MFNIFTLLLKISGALNVKFDALNEQKKLDNSPIGVVELPLYHENELTVGFASRT